jgi:hypothetical protein
MLKKSDLSKQFELVVQQEIKNYQDSLNFVLQSIRELQEYSEKSRIESLEKYAQLQSKHNDLAIQLQTLKEEVAKVDKRLGSHISDEEVFKRKSNQVLAMHSDEFTKNSRENQSNRNEIIGSKSRLDTIENGMQAHSLLLSDALDNLKFKLADDLKKTKEEIISRPSDTVQLKSDLEDKIDSHKVDVSGLMKEISVFKKENFITQKKIENIYTLIERLKKSEGIP